MLDLLSAQTPVDDSVLSRQGRFTRKYTSSNVGSSFRFSVKGQELVPVFGFYLSRFYFFFLPPPFPPPPDLSLGLGYLFSLVAFGVLIVGFSCES